jgi:hypothetical protein
MGGALMSAAPTGGDRWDVSSARVLLEQLCYGHSIEVAAILRFADAHQLQRDDLVFLLVSILKVNEVLVFNLLEAAELIARLVDDARTESARIVNDAKAHNRANAAKLTSLAEGLIARIEVAAKDAAIPLNKAASRFESAVQQTNDLASGLAVLGRDFRSASEAVRKLSGSDDSTRIIAGMHDFIAMQARDYLKAHGMEVIREMRLQSRHRGRVSIVCSIVNVSAVLGLVIWTIWR